MDDNQFDDIIKKKAGDYQEPGFDPAALSDLHYRLATDAVWPWYSRYRTELITCAGLALCTLIILWNQWRLSNTEHMLLNDHQLASIKQGEQMSKLQHEIDYLNTVQPDTIRITEFKEQNSMVYKVLLSRIANLEATLESYRNNRPAQTKKLLQADSLKLVQGYANANNMDEIKYPARLVPRKIDSKSARAQWHEKNIDVEAKQKSLSVKAIRNIEGHYQKGVGIRVGPMLDASKGLYSVGATDRLDVGGGVLADFILSPSLSVETGGKFVHRVYSISDQQEIAEKEFPSVEQDLGTPKNVDIDSWILEIPINLKYRYPLSMKSHWLAGVGLSSMLFTRQALEYDYPFSGNTSASIYSAYTTSSPSFYSGALNFSLGLSNETKRKRIVETSLYYQFGLSDVGAEKNQQSFLGLRSVYWFKVR
jgi:hypothetical protein